MKILFTSSEVVPFAKTGGLADVSGVLPRAIKAEGHDVRVVMPKYKVVNNQKFGLKNLTKSLAIPVGNETAVVSILEGELERGIPVYFIDYEPYFEREELYGTPEGAYEDNAERFILFSRALLEAVKAIGFQPDVIHCNDWQTGLIPVYLKTLYKNDPFFKRTATVMTIHNIAYQGAFPRKALNLAGLSEEEFTPDKLEFYGQVNFLKGGMVYADVLNTVSVTYSKEIQSSPEFGYGLEGVLAHRSPDLYGILNGVDYDEWNPAKDQFIAVKYTLGEIDKKMECKKALLKENNLPVNLEWPLVGIVSRLARQKGLDIIGEAIEEIMDLDLYFILLGTGEEEYHKLFSRIGKKYSRKAAIHITFNNGLAHRIYAGCDLFLMPSRYEPCGLGQLISLAYGTASIVNPTGGLADTIKEFEPETGKGNGFLLSEFSVAGLVNALKRAITVYGNKETWQKLVNNMMKANFSWATSMKEYLKLYQKAMDKRAGN
ncbi:MAG: glycogen synthase GlgA [Elusimicrobiota bacterium]|nr:glycogen synthase GlgA [Elusimicrobiota bacterium]